MGTLLLALYVSRLLLLHENDSWTIIKKILTTYPDHCDNMPRHEVSCHRGRRAPLKTLLQLNVNC